MGAVADTYNGNKNVVQSTLETVASMGLEQTGKKVAGALITPAVWILKCAADGSKPGALDLGLWLSGFVSAPASIVTGYIKAAVDDKIARDLALVQEKEPAPYSNFIKPCASFGSSPPQINALTIASRGGTAWITRVGLWVYITDVKDNLVADYQPKEFIEMIRPKKPYQQASKGRFSIDQIKNK